MYYDEKEEENDPLVLKPAEFFIQFIAYHLNLLSDAFLSLFSLASHTVHTADAAKHHAQTAVQAVPSHVARGGTLLFRKIGLGLLAALHVCVVLVLVIAVSAAVGVGLVRFMAEEPVRLRQPLHFDYTQVEPVAAVSFGGGPLRRPKRGGVPAGHTVDLSVVLLMPESDFNRRIGVFQITAEVVSTNGAILARSSQPCMLRYRSIPIRLVRTFMMGIPLLMGISDETQEITVELLKYKEGSPKTEVIRVKLQPRAGTTFVPELYGANILIHSQLPWRKQLVLKWKWTFYVWSSLYVYIILLIILGYWFRPFIFPVQDDGWRNQRAQSIRAVEEWQSRVGGDGEVSDECSDSLRRWHRSRSKRKGILPVIFSEPVVGSALGASGEGTGEVVEDSTERAPSELECVSSFQPRGGWGHHVCSRRVTSLIKCVHGCCLGCI